MNSKNIITISIIVVVAGLIIAVFVFFGGPKSGVSGGLQTVAPLSAQESNALSRDFLLALSSLNSLELDASFFDDKAFKLLVDYSKDIKDEDVGRDNPFLPVNGSVTPVTQPAVAPIPPITTPLITPPAVPKSVLVKPTSVSTTSPPTSQVVKTVTIFNASTSNATSSPKKVVPKSTSSTSTVNSF